MELTNNAPIAGTSPLGALGTMFYEPTKTFQQLEARPAGWLPLLVVIASSCALMLWYYSIVDFAWLMDQMFATMDSAAEREQAASMMSKNVMLISSLGAVLVGFPIMCAILGAYLMIASRALSHGMSFGKGFALAAWSGVPGLLLFPLGAMQILLASSAQLDYSALNPLSLNQLVLHYNMTHPLASLMDILSLTGFWGIFLLVIGFGAWAKVKRSTAILVVVVPHVAVYGLWLAYGMSKLA